MAKKRRPEGEKKQRAPGKGAWHEMLEQRRKENDKYYDILAGQLERHGFDKLYAAAAQDLRDQFIPRVPEKNNLHIVSLPTIIALVNLIGVLEARAKDAEGTRSKVEGGSR